MHVMSDNRSRVSQEYPAVMSNEEEAERMEGTELEEEPELFVMESLQPMLFSIRVCPEKAKLQRIIEDHGGELTSKAGGPHTLRLLPCGEKAFSTTGDIYSAQYIYDCVKQKKLLDPSKYRVNKKSCYSDDVEILDILRGVRSWADCTRVKVDSVDEVSDFSDDEDYRQQTAQKWKPGRRPYSRKEQKAILDYIIKTKNYAFVKGNSLWKEIEKRQICPNRTWESMKEHYRKAIITDLSPYHLTRKIEARLYEGYTGRKTQEESSDEDKVDSDYEEEGKENRKENCKGSSAEKRVHGTKQEEEPVTQRESSGASGDVDRAEMVRLRDKSNEKSESVENENVRNEEKEREKSGHIDQTAFDQLERQVALFDGDNNGGSQNCDDINVNCTQSFEVDLHSDEFAKKSEVVKNLEEDWEDSVSSFPTKGKEDNEDEKNSGLEATPVEEMHKDKSEDKSRNQLAESDAKKLAKFLLDLTEDSGETVVLEREEAGVVQDHITENVSEQGSVVADDKRDNVCDEGTFQASPLLTNSDTRPHISEEEEPVEDIRNSARGQQITKELLGSFIPDTESSPEYSDVSTVLFSLDEEQNNGEGATLAKSSKRGQSLQKQLKSDSKSLPDHHSSHNSTSEDITPTKPKLRKPPKKRKNWRLSSESSTSGSEVEVTRNRKVDVEQILSHSSNVEGSRPLGKKATPQKQDSLPKRRGKAKEKKTSSPIRRGIDRDKKEVEDEASESETHDLDHSDLLESEDDLNPNVSRMSDPTSSLDTFTGRYDRSFYPSGGNKRGAAGRKSQWTKNYTREEDIMILDHINRQKAYGRLGGIEFWRDMEECSIIPNRSWHSLKERYRKRILPNIHLYVRFGIPKSTIPKFLKFKPTSEEEPQRAKASDTYRQPYSRREDKLILDFIIKNKRYSEVGGKTLWTLMASCEPGLKGRTWLSLKERFRKTIIKNLDSFRLSSNEIHNFQRNSSLRHKAVTHKNPPPGGLFYRFGGGLKKDAKSGNSSKKLSDSEDAEESDQDEEVSVLTDKRTGGKNEDLDHERNREDDNRMETTTSEESESKYSPKRQCTSKIQTRQSPREVNIIPVDNPEISVVNDTVMEKKRKLFTAPEGNRILTPMVVMNALEEINPRQIMKKRRLESTVFSDDGSDKQKGSESGESGRRGKQDDKSDREVTGDSEDDGHKVSVDVSDSEKHLLSSVEGLEHDLCGEEFQRSPEVSKLSSPGNRNVNETKTPPPTSPKTVPRVSPRKRNEMKFKEQKSTSLSETSEIDITGVSDSHSSPDVHKRKKKKTSDAISQSFPGTSRASEPRITRRSLELQKTLPRQKLRVHALQKKR